MMAVDEPNARDLAARVVTAVLNQGVFAAATLDRTLRAYPTLDRRDRALTTELVYGTLRTVRFLDGELRKLASRGMPDAAPEVRTHLLLAAYQLLFLDRVPAFAAVDHAVGAISELADAKVGGFANAVLRRLANAQRPELDEALAQNAPPWLWEALVESVGEAVAKSLLGSTTNSESSAITPSSLRLRQGVAVPDWLVPATRGTVYPPAFVLSKAGDLQSDPLWQQGAYVVQEEGAMFCGAALGARPGETVLDACAGRGQKSSLIAEQLQPDGCLWVSDVGETKLEALNREFSRLGLNKPNAAIIDWTKPVNSPTVLPGQFDRILVDAPCTGTGTLRRRPEICLRLKPKDVERLAKDTERMLRHVAPFVKPDGSVLFVVCSVLRREGEEVVQRVSDIYRETPFDCSLPLLQGQTRFRLSPNEHGTDGFFLASLRRL